MALAMQPFPLSRVMPPRLVRLHRTWQRWIRAENTIPFSDDVDPAALKALAPDLFLIDVISAPPRFRFGKLGAKIVAKLGSDVTGQFADELEVSAPLDYFVAQASATVEARAPTLYSSSAARKGRRSGYARLMLPAWGNGRVDLLLGAIV